MRKILLALLLVAFSLNASADVLKTIQAGATEQSVTIRIIDATDGTPETGVAYNTSGIDLKYWRHGANSAVDITEATQTVNGAHADGGFVHIGHGVYRLDLPDAAVASGTTAVDVFGTVTGMIVIGGTVQLSPPVNMVAVSGDSTAADNLEAAFDGTAGAVLPLGIARQGTAQSATSTTLVLDSAASFADDVPIGMTLVACGSTQGYCQSRVVTDYTSSSDTATVDAWTVTPSGTITYYLFGTAPVSGGGSVTIAAGGITSSSFASGAITSDAIADGAIDAGAIANNAIDAATFASDVGAEILSYIVDDATRIDASALNTATGTLIPAILVDTGTTLAGKLDTIQATTDKLDDTLEDNAGTYRFTEASLAQAPAGEGGGGGTDWDADERTAIRAILGIPVSGSTPADPSSGILAATRDLVAGLNDLSSSDVQSASQIGAAAALTAYDPPTRTELTSDISSVLSAISGLNDIDANDLRDLIIEDQGGGVSLGCALSVILAYAAGDLTTTSNSPTYEDPSGTETRITGTISSAGNRSMTITCPSY